jgi:hypothetical protein
MGVEQKSSKRGQTGAIDPEPTFSIHGASHHWITWTSCASLDGTDTPICEQSEFTTNSC